MKNLGRTYHGTGIPHFRPEDTDNILREHQNDPVGPGVFVSDLHEKLLRPTVLKPMREFTYQKWFLQRMLIIGDAAHQVRKPNVPYLVSTSLNVSLNSTDDNYHCPRRKPSY